MQDPNATSSYDYELPEERIAQTPPERPGDSRLLVLDRRGGGRIHARFPDLPRWLRPGDLLVVNDTKVFQAKVALRRESGGLVPGLLLEPPVGQSVRMMLQGRGRLVEGDALRAGERGWARLVRDEGEGFWTVELDAAARAHLRATGRMPLPPYVRREADDPRDADDLRRYQTMFAEHEGAVAAPTAGLHFTPALLDELRTRGVGVAPLTLHVGPGTFLPVRTESLEEHRLLPERYVLPETTARAIAVTRAAGNRVVAVGTTVVRALESAVRAGGAFAGAGETGLFVRPPFHFRVVDALITNFHLPRSTLLALVAAFAGRDAVLAAYRDAVASGYRFYSYGDAMFIADLEPEEASAGANRSSASAGGP